MFCYTWQLRLGISNQQGRTYSGIKATKVRAQAVGGLVKKATEPLVEE